MKSLFLLLIILSCTNETKWLNSFVKSEEFKTVCKGIDFDSEVTLFIEDQIAADSFPDDFRIVRYKDGDCNFSSQDFTIANRNTIVIFKNLNYDKAWSFYRPYSGHVSTYVLDENFEVKQILTGAF